MEIWGNSCEERGFFEFIFNPCRCRCGISNRNSRLVGGEFSKTHEFPWLAQLQLQSDFTPTATLINDRYLLTSASHLIGLTPLDVKITLGQFDKCYPDVSSSNVSVEKIIIHPEFSQGNRARDLALIKLSTPVKIERRVSPICLSALNTRYLGQVATVSSWVDVSKSEQISYSCRPRKLGLPVLGKDECLQGAQQDTTLLTKDKGCLGVVGSPSPICKSDSGGAVMFRDKQGVYELIGVLSDKNECNLKPNVALFTTVNDVISWVTQNTRDACYCIKM